MQRGKHAIQRGKHARQARMGRWRAPLAILLVSGLLAGGSAYAAYRYDLATSARIMPGVTIAGVDVGGLTSQEASLAVGNAVRSRLEARLVIEAAGRRWRASASELGLGAAIDQAVDLAMASDDRMSFVERAYYRLTRKPLGRSLDVDFSVHGEPIRELADRIARAVAIEPHDARIFLSDGQVVMRRPAEGRALALDPARRAIRSAVAHQRSAVRLSTRPVEPEVSASDLGYTLVVDRAENVLSVYQGFKLVKTYRVATGTPEYETPAGTWKIVDKAENPTWVNPAPNGWGAGLPPVIPGGPGSPLGTRALYLDAPGIRIHGTYDVNSIGTAASHGCIRMTIEDSEELYEYIPIGTTVLIV